MQPAVPLNERRSGGGAATLGRRSRRPYRRHPGPLEPAAVTNPNLKVGDNDGHDCKPPVRKV